MGKDNIVTINFHGNEIAGVKDERGIHIALKPLTNAMGISWEGQLRRIRRDGVLASGTVMMIVPTEGGPQNSTCLRLDLVHGWLFTIDCARLKPDARERVRVFQRDCYAALIAAFERRAAGSASPGVPVQVPSFAAAAVSPRDALRQVTQAQRGGGDRAAQEAWSQLALASVPAMLTFGQREVFASKRA